jgi:hypothetical protein
MFLGEAMEKNEQGSHRSSAGEPEAYDISATADEYFLTRGDAPYCGQRHRTCAN